MTWLAYSHLGVAKTVQLTTQPAVALAGIPFGVQPVGRLVDGSGVLSRATGVTVTASKASGTGTLSGTLSVQTVEGVFTFTDLKMDTVTSAVTLSFASSGLTSATSSAFNVTQPNTIIGAQEGSYALTGTDAAMSRTRVGACTPGVYAVTGTDVTLTYANSSGVTPWLEEDFSSYADAAAVQSASWYTGAPWQDTVWSATNGVSLDTTEGYGTSDRCLKTSFPIGAVNTDGRTINVGLPSSTAEYWSEFWVKISTTFDANGASGGNPDYKFIFWALQPGDGRNEIKVGNGGDMHNLDTRYNAGPDTLYITATNVLNSGIWHRYRAHNKVASGGGSIFSVEFWDGTNAPQLLEQDGFSLSFTSMNYIVLGANRNRTADVAMWIKWGRVTLYNSDPGWGF